MHYIYKAFFFYLKFSDFIAIFEEHLIESKQVDIVCYGIGSVQKSKNAQYQFVLALILRDLLKVRY